MTLYVLLAASAPRQASWWDLAPGITFGVVAIVIGLLGSRRSP